jgi:antirestriction protein
MSTGETVRIYVACLASYNAGRLHGRWIDAAQEPAALRAEIEAMLAESPAAGAEEWAIHDYEGFGPAAIAEYEDVEDVARVAQSIVSHGEAFAFWLSHDPASGRESPERFEDTYLGEHSSEREFCEQLVEDAGLPGLAPPIADELWPYLDLDALWQTLQLGDGYWSTPAAGGGVHVFAPL